MNEKKINSLTQSKNFKMCPNCKEYYNNNEIFDHLESCSPFVNLNNNLKTSSKGFENYSKEKNNFTRFSDPNNYTLGSLKATLRDNKEKEREDNKETSNIGIIYNENNFFNDEAVVTFGARNNININNNFVGITNNFNDNNSFLSVIIQILFSMNKFRNHLNEIKINEKDPKHNLILNLQNTMKKINQIKSKNSNQNLISIKDLRKSLSDLFQSRRKFLLDQPDCPIDAFYAIINSFHSQNTKSQLNEITDTSCNNKCITHKNFFIDLYRTEECLCKGNSKRLYSYHNYIFDLPMMRIINKNKKVELKEIKGKLFYYFKFLIDEIKLNCPEKGVRCHINKTSKKFYIQNKPNFITFNTMHTMSSNFKLINVFRLFLLIPKIFEISKLFYIQDRIEFSYNLIGFVSTGTNKGDYVSFTFVNNLWVCHNDEKTEIFQSWSKLISFCLKNCFCPILLFYELLENDNNINNSNDDLNIEEISQFERFCRTYDNYDKIIQNQFRPNEEIIKYNDENVENNRDRNSRHSTPDVINRHPNYNEIEKINNFRRNQKSEKEIRNINKGNMNRQFSKDKIDDKNASIKIKYISNEDKNNIKSSSKEKVNSKESNFIRSSLEKENTIKLNTLNKKDSNLGTTHKNNNYNLPKQIPKKNNLFDSKEIKEAATKIITKSTEHKILLKIKENNNINNNNIHNNNNQLKNSLKKSIEIKDKHSSIEEINKKINQLKQEKSINDFLIKNNSRPNSGTKKYINDKSPNSRIKKK